MYRGIEEVKRLLVLLLLASTLRLMTKLTSCSMVIVAQLMFARETVKSSGEFKARQIG